MVKKAPGAVLKIVFATPINDETRQNYSVLCETNQEFEPVLEKTKFQLLNPLTVQKLFYNVREEVRFPLFFVRTRVARNLDLKFQNLANQTLISNF